VNHRRCFRPDQGQAKSAARIFDQLRPLFDRGFLTPRP
jgi:hypothetical protein